MIDPENRVIDAVETVLRAAYPTITITSDDTPIAPSFPFVSIVMDDNATYDNTATADVAENHVKVMFTINVYSDLVSGRKSQCKAIMEVIDTKMQSLYFKRTTNSPVPNIDKTIARRTARYEGVVDTTYRVYRR